MAEIDTSRLEAVLLDAGTAEIQDYARQYLSPIRDMTFPEYYVSRLAVRRMSRAAAIANSGLEIHYAYQILSGSKHPTRDKLICLCIGGGLTLQETNRALERAAVGPLYPKRLRDAVIIIAVNRQLRTTWAVNELLARHDQPLLG